MVRETSLAVENGIFDPQALLLRGVAHAHLGNFGQALKDNNRTLFYHPNFLNALNNSGLYYNSLKQFLKAEDALLRALEIHPNHSDALANLGIAYQGLGQFDRSTQSLEKAFALDAPNPTIRTYLAKAYYSQGEFHIGQNDTVKAYESFLKIWQGDMQSAETVKHKLQTLQTL